MRAIVNLSVAFVVLHLGFRSRAAHICRSTMESLLRGRMPVSTRVPLAKLFHYASKRKLIDPTLGRDLHRICQKLGVAVHGGGTKCKTIRRAIRLAFRLRREVRPLPTLITFGWSVRLPLVIFLLLVATVSIAAPVIRARRLVVDSMQQMSYSPEQRKQVRLRSQRRNLITGNYADTPIKSRRSRELQARITASDTTPRARTALMMQLADTEWSVLHGRKTYRFTRDLTFVELEFESQSGMMEYLLDRSASKPTTRHSGTWRDAGSGAIEMTYASRDEMAWLYCRHAPSTIMHGPVNGLHYTETVIQSRVKRSL